MISQDQIDRVKSLSDIISIVGEYVQLKRSGSNYKGLCPFHNEKTPSFMVSEDKQIFKCFGCGEGGDVISFVMKREGLNYPEAIRFLAEKAGIQIDEGYVDHKRIQERKRQLVINKEAMMYYYQHLLVTPKPQNYLKNRGLSGKMMNQFMLGYADESWESLRGHLLQKGFKEEELFKVGLLSSSRKSDRHYDRFRDRLMFPIINTKKEIIGFGGRIIGDGEPKYLNSPESALFQKGENLYGLNRVHFHGNREEIVLVEGYMDVIAMAFHGMDFAVASLGTALTEAQGHLMRRYGKKVYICYDSDAAGINATIRGIEVLRKVDVDPYIIRLPHGLDPDDYMKSYGLDAFRKLMDNAYPSMDYLLTHYAEKYNTKDPGDFSLYLDDVIPLLSRIPRDVERDLYIKKIAMDQSLDESSLKEDVQRFDQNQKMKMEVRTQRENAITHREMGNNKLDIAELELEYLLYLVVDAGYWDALKPYKSTVQHPLAQKMMEVFFESQGETTDELLSELGGLADEPGADQVNAELKKRLGTQIINASTFEELLQKLSLREVTVRRETLLEEIGLAYGSDLDDKNNKAILKTLLEQLTEADRVYEERSNRLRGIHHDGKHELGKL